MKEQQTPPWTNVSNKLKRKEAIKRLQFLTVSTVDSKDTSDEEFLGIPCVDVAPNDLPLALRCHGSLLKQIEEPERLSLHFIRSRRLNGITIGILNNLKEVLHADLKKLGEKTVGK